MKKEEYEKTGLKCGLEIHQQLEGKKLFCKCPTKIHEEKPDYTIHRKIRAVTGETGEIDIAAAEEASKGKLFEYECYNDNVCLVELDEEPPRDINKKALEATLQVCKLVKAKIVDEGQVMRKTIIDGSNVTGFQRTTLIGYDGEISSSQGKIRIPTIILEEDSARHIKTEGNKTVYRLDRLGIPLIEISTAPDIKTPEQLKEVAEKIGMILRSTGKCKRGLGTIRQDVNVSIKEGNRIEIKGAQDLKMLPTLVKIEAERQKKLIEIREELKKRGVKTQEPKIEDISKHFKKCQGKIIQETLKKGGKVLGIRLTGFKGLIGKEIQPNKRLGTEFSHRAKTTAGVKGIIHSDELPNYGITPDILEKLNKHFDLSEKDAFIIVAEQEDKAKKALQAVIKRANECLKGVPKEVRGANKDGTTTYQRPIPGAARMYPETDVLPIKIDKKITENIKLPELIENKIKRYKNMGLGKDLAETLAKSDKAQLFDKLTQKIKKIKTAYIAEILTGAEKTIKRQFNVEINPTEEDYTELFEALEKEKISKESILEILKENKPVKETIKKYETISDEELKKEIKKIIEENKNLEYKALIGKVMQKLRGKASGKKIAETVKKLSS